MKSIPLLVCAGVALCILCPMSSVDAQSEYASIWNGELKIYFNFDDWAPKAGHRGYIDIGLENQDDSPMRVELLAIQFDWQDVSAFFSDDMDESNPLEIAAGETKWGITIEYWVDADFAEPGYHAFKFMSQYALSGWLGWSTDSWETQWLTQQFQVEGISQEDIEGFAFNFVLILVLIAVVIVGVGVWQYYERQSRSQIQSRRSTQPQYQPQPQAQPRPQPAPIQPPTAAHPPTPQQPIARVEPVKMKTCPICGHQNMSDARFCNTCGKPY